MTLIQQEMVSEDRVQKEMGEASYGMICIYWFTLALSFTLFQQGLANEERVR